MYIENWNIKHSWTISVLFRPNKVREKRRWPKLTFFLQRRLFVIARLLPFLQSLQQWRLQECSERRYRQNRELLWKLSLLWVVRLLIRQWRIDRDIAFMLQDSLHKFNQFKSQSWTLLVHLHKRLAKSEIDWRCWRRAHMPLYIENVHRKQLRQWLASLFDCDSVFRLHWRRFTN